MAEPYIILLMNHEIDFYGGIEPELLMECDDDGDALIFADFNSAKQYKEDNALDGIVVLLPIY